LNDMHDMRRDHIMMQAGRVLIMRNGETMPMDEEITMPDGTRVTTDGTVRNPDRTTRMLAEGETMSRIFTENKSVSIGEIRGSVLKP
jgi:hypothetical protein